MQYFLGYSNFTTEPPFDAFFFIEFRKRLGLDSLNAINDKIVALKTQMEASKVESKPSGSDKGSTDNNSISSFDFLPTSESVLLFHLWKVAMQFPVNAFSPTPLLYGTE